jgi:ferritin heavy chain
MAYYWDRQENAMFGMADLNKLCTRGELRSAKLLMDYIVARGGRVAFFDIKKPERQEWDTPLNSLEYLLQMKKNLQKSIHAVHEIADNNNDEQLKEYLEVEFLEPAISFTRKGN